MFRRKKAPLFGGGIEPDCRCCVHGPGPAAACSFRAPGAEENAASCRAFRYDPLKRAPVTLPPLKKHDPGEFEL